MTIVERVKALKLPVQSQDFQITSAKPHFSRVRNQTRVSESEHEGSQVHIQFFNPIVPSGRGNNISY